jgi:acetyl-CoA carboxylase biotin carboxyl carrier protein
MVNESNIGEVTIEQKDFKITVRQKEEQITQVVASTANYSQLPQAFQQQALPSVPSGQQAPAAPAQGEAAAPATTVTIKSPMIGTFYSRPSPDKPNFVEIGSEVAPGKVVCIIEAMKLFNEIESEVKGRIVKVLVDEASPVEYDQPLFLVEPA